MATDFKSPLGLLDYLVPDQIEKMAISGFAQPLTPEQLAKENDAQRKARLTQYGSFTPDIDPNNPTGLSNIQTLLGNAYMPQVMNYGAGKGPSNKQMIDAAILRAGLELGKGRLPGENFGVALNRGMEAFGAPAKTLTDAQAAAAKAAAATAKGIRPQVSITTPKLFVFKNVASNLFDNNEIFRKTVELLTDDGIFRMKSPAIQALAGNAISYQSEFGGSIENAIMKSAEGMLNLKTTGETNSNPNDSANSNSNSSNLATPDLSNIEIK